MGVRCVVACVALLMATAPNLRVHAQAAPQVSAETEQRAREAFQRGRIHYDNGEFDAAAQAFEEAHSLSGRHALLYNLYLAYRDANQQEKAAEALRNYLANVPVIENRPQLEARLKALEEGIAQRRASAAQQAAQQQQAPKDQAQPQAPEPSAPVAVAAKPKWWPIPVSVLGAGAALMIGSVATGVMASSKAKQLEDECGADHVCDPSLKSTADSGKTLALVTDVLLFGGAAVAATGAVLLLLKRPKADEAKTPEPATTTASVVCTTRVCGASVGVRF